jgi:glycosyltransferase involved in cell wall biosynthesis
VPGVPPVQQRAAEPGAGNAAPLNLLIVSFYFPPDYSGAGRQMLAMAKQLLKLPQVASVEVLAAATAGGKAHEEIDGVVIHRFEPRARDYHQLPNAWHFCRAIMHHISAQRGRYDVVQFASIGQFLFLAVPWLRLRWPWLKLFARCALMGHDDLVTLRASRLGWLKLRILSQLDGIVTLSPPLSKACPESMHQAGKIIEIGNGVDLEVYQPPQDAEAKKILRRELGLPESGFVACFSGHLSPRKNPLLLVEAWLEEISPRLPGARLLLLGPSGLWQSEGSYQADLSRLLSKAAPGGIILKQVDEVAPYLKASDLFVLPSEMEGFPNALAEAQASGLPAVVLKRPWLWDEIVGHGVDGLVVRGGRRALGEAILSLAEDPVTRADMGRRARAKAVSRWGLEQVSAAYLEMYASRLA